MKQPKISTKSYQVSALERTVNVDLADVLAERTAKVDTDVERGAIRRV